MKRKPDAKTTTKQHLYYPKFDNKRDYDIFAAGVAMGAQAMLDCGGQTIESILRVLKGLGEGVKKNDK